MKLAYLIFPMLLVFACSASRNTPIECPQMMCTQEFRMVQVGFSDASGNPVTVKDFSAVIRRTGKNTAQSNETPASGTQIGYTVASDADVRNLAESGDTISVSATHPETNKKVSADLVVSGGQCACHINKISGPDLLTF